MGNCCTMHGASPSAVWAGDDWEPMSPERRPTEKDGLLGGSRGGGELSSTVGTTSDQVRIRITKQQLEQLLRRVDGGGTRMKKLKVEQVLQRLIDQSDYFEIHHHHHHDHHHQRSWKPALQSIPEVN